MTLAANVRTHKLSQNATLCESGFNQVGADSPAIEAMTDFARINVVAIAGNASVDDAENTPDSPSSTMSLTGDRRLLPSMQLALDSVARRYRVSNEVLEPIFLAAQESGQELGLDPLLIIAVIGVESGFNPFSQSVVGAQGLMQVMPRFHSDKLPEDAGSLPFFDPIINVQIGARILRESIARNGGLVPGLQQFGGALNDPEQRYASKVMTERRRLEAALQSVKRRA